MSKHSFTSGPYSFTAGKSLGSGAPLVSSGPGGVQPPSVGTKHPPATRFVLAASSARASAQASSAASSLAATAAAGSGDTPPRAKKEWTR